MATPPPLPRVMSVPPPLPWGPPPPLPMVGMYCQGCQSQAPTKEMLFIRHIGAVVIAINEHTAGHFCRSCANEHFARNTLITSFLGWWGIRSFFFNPFFLLNNLVHFLSSRTLEPAPGRQVTGTDAAVAAFAIATGFLLGLAYAVCRVFR